MTFYQKTILPSGLRVVTEAIPTVRSVAVGIWVGAGSLWETENTQGLSHLIEHMMFKGTARRTARQLAEEIDGRGGSLNAFTAKEHTCYYARVLDEHLPVAMDVLFDMLQGSLFDPGELKKEKGVIAEEIRMCDDVPDEIVHDLFAATAWPDHPLGRPVLGTEETVLAATRELILEYRDTHYTADNMVVAAAGHLDHDRVVALVAEAVGDSRTGNSRPVAWPQGPAHSPRPRAAVRHRETEQVHLVMGGPGLPTDHPDIYALHVLNTVLDGGATSRLFQEIREERGLAYSVYSYTSSFRDAGLFGVYCGTAPGSYREVLGLITQTLDRLAREGLSAREVAQAREQLKGNLMLAMESTSGRMTRLGRGELSLGHVLSPDEVLARIDAVTQEQVRDLCGRLFGGAGRVLSLVGPFAELPDLGEFGFTDEVAYG